MSRYVWDSNVSYLDYVQTKSFASDLSSSARKAGKSFAMNISHHTRDSIASKELLEGSV